VVIAQQSRLARELAGEVLEVGLFEAGRTDFLTHLFPLRTMPVMPIRPVFVSPKSEFPQP
jgi:hypothetical protein